MDITKYYSTGYVISIAALMCVFRSRRSVEFDVENVTVSTTFGLGASFFFADTPCAPLRFH